MVGAVSHNQNDGRVAGIAIGNQLGPGIGAASLRVGTQSPAPSSEGSWCTCQLGAARRGDVCHLQFKSKVGFKLVWCAAEDWAAFRLVGDEGEVLAGGVAHPPLPPLSQRRGNAAEVAGSVYGAACDRPLTAAVEVPPSSQ